jgi:hypothetical protein
MNAKPVLTAKIESETGRGDIVATIAAALSPSAVVNLPMLGAVLLPGAIPLPATALL